MYVALTVIKQIIGDVPLFDFVVRFVSHRLLNMNMNTQALTCTITARKSLLTNLLTHIRRGKLNNRLVNSRRRKWRPACWRCVSFMLPHLRRKTVAGGCVGTASWRLIWRARGATTLWKSGSTAALATGSSGGAPQNSVGLLSVLEKAVFWQVPPAPD